MMSEWDKLVNWPSFTFKIAQPLLTCKSSKVVNVILIGHNLNFKQSISVKTSRKNKPVILIGHNLNFKQSISV
jgi:hypothetical protein